MKSSKILIKINNCYSQIVGDINPYVERQISDVMSYKVIGSEHSKEVKEGRWDGRTRLYKFGKQVFPTGLAPELISVLTRTGTNYRITDERVKPIKKFDYEIKADYETRDYQVQSVKDVVSSTRGLINIATGGGKTYIMMMVAKELGVKTLIIVNTREAVDSTYETAVNCFPEEKIGLFTGNKNNTGEFITIATMSKITTKDRKTGGYKNIDFMYSQGFDAIFIDEAHHLGNTLWSTACLSISAYYRYAFTATSFREDGADIYIKAVTGRTLVKISTEELIKKGHLVTPKVTFHIVNLIGFDFPMQYQDTYTGGIVRNKYRNDMIEDLVRENLGKSILVIFHKLDHGDILYERIKKIDKNCALISGTTKDRGKLKSMFASGDVKTVIASSIYNESADIPIIEVLINTAGGKSGIQVIQRIGRSLRKSPGKKKAMIHDFYDRFNSKLEGHSVKRLKWVKESGLDYEVNGDLSSDYVFGCNVGNKYKDEEE